MKKSFGTQIAKKNYQEVVMRRPKLTTFCICLYYRGQLQSGSQ